MVHTALSWSNAACFDPILSAEVTLKFALLLECKAGLPDQSRVSSAEMETPVSTVAPEQISNAKQVRYATLQLPTVMTSTEFLLRVDYLV